jgi:hypothetical protein
LYERIHQLQEQFQPKEDWLQRYIGKHPEVLPMLDLEGIDLGLRLIARELKDIDLLFADEGGLLTIVETKLVDNPEGRRQVIAQVLDYASRLGKMDVLSLCKELSLQKKKEETLRDFPKIRDLSKLLFECLQSETADSQIKAKRILAYYVVSGMLKSDPPWSDAKPSKERDFLERLDQMLKEGSFRLVIVTYRASPQLIDITNHTNSIMQNGNQLVVVELSKDPPDNPTRFIPHLVGAPRKLSSYYYREFKSLERVEKEWDKELFFDALSNNAPDLLSDLQILVSEIEKNEDHFSYDFGSGGVFGAIQIWLKFPETERYHLVNIRTDGSIILYFHPYKTQEKRLWTDTQEEWALKVISSRTCLEKAKQQIEKSREKNAYHGGEPYINIRNCASSGERWKFLFEFFEDFRDALILNK